MAETVIPFRASSAHLEIPQSIERRARRRQDPHREWLRGYFLARRTFDQRTPDDPLYEVGFDNDPAHIEMDRLNDLILATPFFTQEGALCRLALLADYSLACEPRDEITRPALLSALAVLGISGWSSP